MDYVIISLLMFIRDLFVVSISRVRDYHQLFIFNRTSCSLYFWDLPMVQGLGHYVVNSQVVGSNSVYTCGHMSRM